MQVRSGILQYWENHNWHDINFAARSSMNENCATMPPTNERESSKSPSGNHSIDDILGLKATQMAASSSQQQNRHAYSASGSDSSSDSSSNGSASEPDTSPTFPVSSRQQQQQQLLQVATTAGLEAQQRQGELAVNNFHGLCLTSYAIFLKQFCKLHTWKVSKLS